MGFEVGAGKKDGIGESITWIYPWTYWPLAGYLDGGGHLMSYRLYRSR